MYVVIGADGKESEPMDMVALQSMAANGAISRQTIVICPSKARVAAGMLDDLTPSFPQDPAARSGGIEALIPTKNPKALLAYYFGYAAMIPVLGLFFTPIVFIWARKGLAAFRSNPEIHGRGHAIAGMVFVGIGLLINLPLWSLMIAAIANGRR